MTEDSAPSPDSPEAVAAALEQFVLDNAELEELEALLDDFNPFVAMRWTRQELRHSAFLRWLLDPSETHGLGSYFLKTFLKRLAHQGSARGAPSVVEIDASNLDQAHVVVEWRNIDILVRDDSVPLVAVIENKVDAFEHDRQLQRYRQFVTEHFRDHKKLFGYLTVSGDDATDDAYAAITYPDVIEAIEVTLDRRGDQIAPEVNGFLTQYVEMLRRHIVQDSDIQDLCRRIYNSHRRALDVLFEHRPDRAATVRDALVGLVESTPGLIHDHSHKYYVRFIPKQIDFFPRGRAWTKSGRMLLFELDQSSGGVKLKLALGPGDQAARARIADHIAGTKGVFNRSDVKVPKQWWGCHIVTWVPKKAYESSDEEELIDTLTERFKRFVDAELPALVEALTPLASERWDVEAATASD